MKGQEAELEILEDVELARRFGARDPQAVRTVTERNNRRLFRAAWSILKDRGEAEDVVQSTYMFAFAAIDSFAGRSSLSTWLTRIAINEALRRYRRSSRQMTEFDDNSVVILQEYRDKLMRGSSTRSEPDFEASRAQLRRLIETAVAGLPNRFRTVFILREIEQLSVDEVAAILGIPPATVKTRCLRARQRLQKNLRPLIGRSLAQALDFAGADCEAMTARVLERLCGIKDGG